MPQIGATHCYALLRHLDKGCVTKGLVVYYVVWLGSINGMVLCCGKDGYRAQVPQHPFGTTTNMD